MGRVDLRCDKQDIIKPERSFYRSTCALIAETMPVREEHIESAMTCSSNSMLNRIYNHAGKRKLQTGVVEIDVFVLT
jgi:hypothetical protein